MKEKRRFKKMLASILIIALAVFLGITLYPYINGFFGAIIVFVLFKPVFEFFIEKWKMNKTIAALLILLLTILIVLIPMGFVLNAIVGEVAHVFNSQGELIKQFDKINEMFPQVDLKEILNDQLDGVGEWIKNLALSSIAGIGTLIITLTIFFFVLFYLFVEQEKFEKILWAVIPFKKKNKEHLIEEFKNVTYSTVVTTGLIAVIQGVLLSISFLIFGVPGAIVWGFIGAILSFLPVVGVVLIWVPASLIYLFQANYFAGIGLFIAGLIMSNIDNFLRPIIQKKMGKMHPLISLVGIFIGIEYFGIIGIVIGPLLLSYFILICRMFREEYS